MKGKKKNILIWKENTDKKWWPRPMWETLVYISFFIFFFLCVCVSDGCSRYDANAYGFPI